MEKDKKKIAIIIGVIVLVLILFISLFAIFFKDYKKPSNETPSVNKNVSDTNDVSNTDSSTVPPEKESSTEEEPVNKYNDVSKIVADLPKKEALDALFALLKGYWITEENSFVFFSVNNKGQHYVGHGLFQTEFCREGKLIDATPVSKYEIKLLVYFPAIPATEMYDAVPETTETFYLDVTGLKSSNGAVSKDSKIIFKADGLETYTYVPAGNTLDEAFKKWDKS
ncbi:MAG: hypothetical protein GX241_00595 [Ruminococcaceae bacterium]|mgnify:CR=1 FL=1|nr:hypothetical protein [Oscillospiraceae bacterium]